LATEEGIINYDGKEIHYGGHQHRVGRGHVQPDAMYSTMGHEMKMRRLVAKMWESDLAKPDEKADDKKAKKGDDKKSEKGDDKTAKKGDDKKAQKGDDKKAEKAKDEKMAKKGDDKKAEKAKDEKKAEAKDEKKAEAKAAQKEAEEAEEAAEKKAEEAAEKEAAEKQKRAARKLIEKMRKAAVKARKLAEKNKRAAEKARAKKAREGALKGMTEGNGAPSQGFRGKIVEHDDQKTQTEDWNREYGSNGDGLQSWDKICKENTNNVWCKHHLRKKAVKSGAAVPTAIFAVFLSLASLV